MLSYVETLERAETAVAIFRGLPRHASYPHDVTVVGADLTDREWDCVTFAGVGYSTSRTNISLSKEWGVNPPNGEWFAVLRSTSSSRYVVTCDPFGFSPLYLAEICDV